MYWGGQARAAVEVGLVPAHVEAGPLHQIDVHEHLPAARLHAVHGRGVGEVAPHHHHARGLGVGTERGGVSVVEGHGVGRLAGQRGHGQGGGRTRGQQGAQAASCHDSSRTRGAGRWRSGAVRQPGRLGEPRGFAFSRRVCRFASRRWPGRARRPEGKLHDGGFSDPTHIGRRFKKMYGRLSSEVRKPENAGSASNLRNALMRKTGSSNRDGPTVAHAAARAPLPRVSSSISTLVCLMLARLEAPKTIDLMAGWRHTYSIASRGEIAPEASTDIATGRKRRVAIVASAATSPGDGC